MTPSNSNWKTFVHPHKAFRLKFPAHWENRVEKDGQDCGFGPYERDNVGLWISVMSFSLDTDRLADELARLFEQVIDRAEATNVRADPSLNHRGLKADICREGQGGHYWILAGGDLVVFASSQVPVDERDTWNPLFDRVLASLHITRDDQLLLHKVGDEVMRLLRERDPDQEYSFDGKGIRGRGHHVFLDNVWRQVCEEPDSMSEIVREFVTGLEAFQPEELGCEQWEAVQESILPLLKPLGYIRQEGPTQHLTFSEWISDVVICYAIRNEKAHRFLTGWDLNRWGIDQEQLHQRAIANLSALPWPHRLEGSRQPGGGRLIMVSTGDGFDASRLLHPQLHMLFAHPLGTPFLAGIPDRDTLVTFSNRRAIRKRVARLIRRDHDKSAYAISPRVFLVTPDGIAPDI